MHGATLRMESNESVEPRRLLSYLDCKIEEGISFFQNGHKTISVCVTNIFISVHILYIIHCQKSTYQNSIDSS